DAIVPWAQMPASVLNSKEHQQLALEIAQKSMTLLQNKNNILPLNKNSNKLASIGPNVDNEPMLWGNYNGTPHKTITIRKGIESKVTKNKILYDKSSDLVEEKITKTYFDQISFEGEKGMKATYWNNPDREG
ncbi:glycosyl hydrolase, partial [Flavobacterium sp. IR1]